MLRPETDDDYAPGVTGPIVDALQHVTLWDQLPANVVVGVEELLKKSPKRVRTFAGCAEQGDLQSFVLQPFQRWSHKRANQQLVNLGTMLANSGVRPTGSQLVEFSASIQAIPSSSQAALLAAVGVLMEMEHLHGLVAARNPAKVRN